MNYLLFNNNLSEIENISETDPDEAAVRVLSLVRTILFQCADSMPAEENKLRDFYGALVGASVELVRLTKKAEKAYSPKALPELHHIKLKEIAEQLKESEIEWKKESDLFNSVIKEEQKLIKTKNRLDHAIELKNGQLQAKQKEIDEAAKRRDDLTKQIRSAKSELRRIENNFYSLLDELKSLENIFDEDRFVIDNMDNEYGEKTVDELIRAAREEISDRQDRNERLEKAISDVISGIKAVYPSRGEEKEN